MEDDFEGLVKECNKGDVIALTSQVKEHESLLRLKRRWLMDLPLSKKEQKRVEELLPPNEKFMPESLLREDDISYENIRTIVEKAFGAHNHETETQISSSENQIFSSREDFKDLIYLLDDMTNTGLYSLLEILTGGSLKFQKTNTSMKRAIKEHLRTLLTDTNPIFETKSKQIQQLFKNPRIIRGYQTTPSIPLETYRAAGIKVLQELEEFPYRALLAMHRKLKGITGYTPTMSNPKYGHKRNSLIISLRKKCMKMLSNLSEINKPEEPLSKALGVAGLTLKVLLNQPDVIQFHNFSPETVALQNEIAKAIWLVNYESRKVSPMELKKLNHLLAPDADLSVRSLRPGVRNLLIEYLFECGDMVEKIPDSLLEILEIINRRKHSTSGLHSSEKVLEEEIEKEVESILNVSAQSREVVLNSISGLDFDQDFADAYMDDFDESVNFCDPDEDENMDFHSNDADYDESESVGENTPPPSPSGKTNVPLETNPDKTQGFLHSPLNQESTLPEDQFTDRKPSKQDLCSLSHTIGGNSSQNGIKIEETTKGPKFEFPDEQKKALFGNQYLEIQEACDTTSMVAYRFVGHVLDELAKSEQLELSQGDRSYLRSNALVPEDSEESSQASLESKFSRIWKDVLES